MERFKKIIVDGNDGTGKTTLTQGLLEHGYIVSDRGIPTQMTDNPNIKPNENELYIILDAPIEVCRKRLEEAGKDLTEQYHTIEDLTHYRQRFLGLIDKLPNLILLDATPSKEEVLTICLQKIKEFR